MVGIVVSVWGKTVLQCMQNAVSCCPQSRHCSGRNKSASGPWDQTHSRICRWMRTEGFSSSPPKTDLEGSMVQHFGTRQHKILHLEHIPIQNDSVELPHGSGQVLLCSPGNRKKRKGRETRCCYSMQETSAQCCRDTLLTW